MNEGFIKQNSGNYYFNKDEIITQLCPKYEDISVFKSRINQILPDVLKNLHIDIKVFKERNNKYRIPILFAEIIYIIVKEATNDSSKNSFVSKLKNNKFEELSFNDKVTFITVSYTHLTLPTKA